MFKLVRIDTEDANEIQLPEGTYLIGRDKLIGFDDKRISWNHGLIFVKGDSVTIESSQRKLYLTKKGSKEKEVLNKTFKTALEIGDRFGFLSDSYWYEVQSSGNGALKETNFNTLKSPHFTMEQSSILNHSLEEEKPKKRKKESLKSDNRKLKRRKQWEDEASDVCESDKSSVSDEEENSPSPALKRERCKYGADCYSIRTLRHNPAHQAHTARYSHPRDPDWGGTDPSVCPLGAACRRRGARHARAFRHPVGHRIPPPVPRTKANKCWRRHTIYSESDSDSPEPRVVLRSKRQRKPLPKQDPEDLEDESEGEEDPFASDGSDDWRPEQDEKDLWF